MGNLGPSMIWTNCPGSQIYDRCLKVQFPSETDFALLTEKSPFNKCIYEGHFKKAPKTRVFVSSEECPITDGSKIQVNLCFRCHYQLIFLKLDQGQRQVNHRSKSFGVHTLCWKKKKDFQIICSIKSKDMISL